MSKDPLEAIERLEKLATWHRINAEHAGADWVWEARLRTAEDLERRAAKIRGQLSVRALKRTSPRPVLDWAIERAWLPASN